MSVLVLSVASVVVSEQEIIISGICSRSITGIVAASEYYRGVKKHQLGSFI